eukprot:jgi/Chlat1/5442/Chrsp36S05440
MLGGAWRQLPRLRRGLNGVLPRVVRSSGKPQPLTTALRTAAAAAHCSLQDLSRPGPGSYYFTPQKMTMEHDGTYSACEVR